MKHATEMETCTKIYFLFIFNLMYMRIRKKLAILTLQFDEVTVKTIYNNNIINVNDIKSKTTRFSEMDLLKTINSHF